MKAQARPERPTRETRVGPAGWAREGGVGDGVTPHRVRGLLVSARNAVQLFVCKRAGSEEGPGLRWRPCVGVRGRPCPRALSCSGGWGWGWG